MLVTSVAISCGILLAAAPARAEPRVRITGTGTALGAMRQLTAAYAEANPGERAEVLPSVGSAGALKAVAEGALDVALSGRPLEPRERGLGLVERAYARTPFLFAVGKRVDVRTVTRNDLARLYRGDLDRWPNGERARLVLRPRADADTRLLRAISPEMAEAVEASFHRDGMLVAATNQECDAILARTPGAVGPSTLTQLVTESRALTPLALDGVEPTLANLASGVYPLAKTLYAVVGPRPSERARRFVAFLGSPEARRILERTGNLPMPFEPVE